MTPASNNSTKSTPCLSADIFGDWREEVIWRNGNNPAQLYIFSTSIPTKYRVPTLMHDNVYRLGITWQNSAYNQPPHLSYYLPDYAKQFEGVEDTTTGVTNVNGDSQAVLVREYYTLDGKRTSRSAMSSGVYVEHLVKENGEVVNRKYICK